MAERAGMIDSWANAFLPDREVLWDASLEAQGVPIKVRRDPEDSFCDTETMIERMDAIGLQTLVLPVCDLPPHAGVTDAFDAAPGLKIPFRLRPHAGVAGAFDAGLSQLSGLSARPSSMLGMNSASARNTSSPAAPAFWREQKMVSQKSREIGILSLCCCLCKANVAFSNVCSAATYAAKRF